MTESGPDLLGRLAAFGRLLHELGLDAGPGRLITAGRALAAIDIADLEAFRDSLRACFVGGHAESDVFDAAFDFFWLPADLSGRDGGGRGQLRSLDPPAGWDRARPPTRGPEPGPGEAEADDRGDRSGQIFSDRERLQNKDFEALTPEESEEVARLLRRTRWNLAQRRTRRRRRARRGTIDARGSIRESIHAGGEMMRVLRRQRVVRERPLVLICDVSGSMAGYSRMLLIFAHAIASRSRVETFVFSTRLSRVTRALRVRDMDQVLANIGLTVHDFSGGTRIGDALAQFNRRWARRVLGHGAVLIMISDGWDRGDPTHLAQELSRLRRTVHRLIWLNPLLGSKEYQPLTRGMAAALPHTDDFLPANNLRSLDQLGSTLASIGSRRDQRR